MYRNRILPLLSIAFVLLAVAVAMSVQAQTVRPDRISFYNVPSHSGKYESHIDYADGRSQRKSYGACSEGAVIIEPLNIYTATFVTEGCTEETFQQLNLRWLAACDFDFEYDPAARIDTYGSYGQVAIAGHYPEGQVTLPIPAGTVSMTATMSETINGVLTTGNVTMLFNEPIGCVEPPPAAPEPPTATQTPTEAATPAEASTVTPTASATPEPTATATATATATPEPTPTYIVVCCAEPAPQPQPPTGEDETAEPVRNVFLPVVVQ